MNKQLAKVTKASLEIKERNILNFWIHVEYEEGGGQGVGGICLDTWDENKKRRVGTAYGCEMIRRLLKIFNVDDLSEVKDQYIWVLGEGDGLSFKPKGFQQMKDQGGDAFLFEEVYEEFGKEMDQ